jgi:hypothetical protein
VVGVRSSIAPSLQLSRDVDKFVAKDILDLALCLDGIKSRRCNLQDGDRNDAGSIMCYSNPSDCVSAVGVFPELELVNFGSHGGQTLRGIPRAPPLARGRGFQAVSIDGALPPLRGRAASPLGCGGNASVGRGGAGGAGGGNCSNSAARSFTESLLMALVKKGTRY